MTKFIGIKIHDDTRDSIKSYAKYSRVATKPENDYFLALYRSGKGGHGFHECMNFAVTDGDNVRLYIPPTCIPRVDLIDAEEFVIFSFNYFEGSEAQLVGIHAGARFVNGREGLPRRDVSTPKGVSRLWYHAEAPAARSSLISPPLRVSDLPLKVSLKKWKQGLRYFDINDATMFVASALKALEADSKASSDRNDVEPEMIALAQQRDVLHSILATLRRKSAKSTQSPVAKPSITNAGAWVLPDSALGLRGEEIVFKAQLEYAKGIGQPASSVQWISQALPASPYDIVSVREIDGVMVPHYIEVKTAKSVSDPLIFVSRNQIEVLKRPGIEASLALVTIDQIGNEKIEYFSFAMLEQVFEFEPVKYQLLRRKKQLGPRDNGVRNVRVT